MLTPEFLEDLPEPIVALYQEAEDAILEDMARRIASADLWTASADWQYRKLREAGALSEDIIAELSRRTGKTKAELKKLMQAAAIQSMGYDESIYEANGMTGEPLASSEALTDILNAGYQATVATMRNLTRTTAQTASQQFERALDAAWMKVQSGAFSADAAIKSAVNELAEKGVEAIEYESARKDTIEAAVRRAVVTGVNQTCGQLQLERAHQMGADLMELTAHEGARPSHAEWQGQIVSLSGRPGYLSLEDIGFGDVAGFKGANCRHDWNPWFEGMPRTWTPEALAKLNEPKYEWNGKKLTEAEARDIQRYNERQIRKWKRVYAAQKAAGQDTSEAAAKISEWNKRQGDFLRATGFKRRQSREEIAGFGLKETREASKDVIVTNTPKKPESPTYGYNDVTREWLDKATPNSHEVRDLRGFVQDGQVYIVDGKNVKLDYDDHEKEIAELLESKLGGDIRMMPKVSGDFKNVRTPDYLFRGERFDLKTMSRSTSKNAVYNRLSESQNQADNFVLDITQNPLGTEEIMRQAENVFTSYHLRGVQRLIIVEQNEITRILERK